MDFMYLLICISLTNDIETECDPGRSLNIKGYNSDLSISGPNLWSHRHTHFLDCEQKLMVSQLIYDIMVLIEWAT